MSRSRHSPRRAALPVDRVRLRRPLSSRTQSSRAGQQVDRRYRAHSKSGSDPSASTTRWSPELLRARGVMYARSRRQLARQSDGTLRALAVASCHAFWSGRGPEGGRVSQRCKTAARHAKRGGNSDRLVSRVFWRGEDFLVWSRPEDAERQLWSTAPDCHESDDRRLSDIKSADGPARRGQESSRGEELRPGGPCDTASTAALDGGIRRHARGRRALIRPTSPSYGQPSDEGISSGT